MLWQIKLIVSRETLDAFIELLGSESLSIAAFETDSPELWRLQAILNQQPSVQELQAKIALQATLLNIPIPELTLEEVPEQDWLTANQESFPPLEIGRFYIHGSHIQGSPPEGKIPLQIDAGLAFGTGDHATTTGCLLALEDLHKQADTPNKSSLDMGCGSGILAFAISKLWKCPVWAVDNDADAIAVAQANAQLNKIDHITFQVAEGFAKIAPSQQFSLITANILANPLCAMATFMARHCQPGGYVVLSGILKTQAQRVINCYLQAGFTLNTQQNINEWATLLIQHP